MDGSQSARHQNEDIAMLVSMIVEQERERMRAEFILEHSREVSKIEERNKRTFGVVLKELY